MRFKTVLFICAALIGKCYSANDGGCIINDENINWANNIYTHAKITDIEKLNKVFEFEGDLVLNDTEAGPNGQFIEVRVDSEQKQLIFETNEDFDNFDKSVPKQSARTVTMVTTAHLQCSAGKTILRFSVDVEDTNNHDPTFGQPSYTYNMPMPLIPRIDLTSLGDEIIATDVDFSNQNVEFTIDPPGTFELTTISSSKSKDYRAVLKVTEFTWLTEETTYTITATDSGDPPRKSTTSLTITLDETNILPDVPKFSASSYRFKYIVDDKGNPTLTPSTNDPISITVTDPDAVSVKLEENDYFTYFTANFDPKTKQVTIGVTDKTIDVTSEHVIVLTLTVTLNNNKDESSKATILVDIPKENVISAPIFTEPYYTATYSSSHTVALDNGKEIAVKQNADNVKIELAGEYGDNFGVECESNEKCTLKVKNDLPPEVLKSELDIVIVLSASLEDVVEPGTATVLINLPKKSLRATPVFSKTFYTYTYTIDEKNSTSLNGETISVISDYQSDVEVKVDDEHSKYFEILSSAGTAGEWNLQVVTPLDEDILEENTEIVVELVASLDNAVSVGTAAVVISLPEKRGIPLFTRAYYTARYTTDSSGDPSVEVIGDKIAVTSDFESDVEVDISGDYKENFKLNYNKENHYWQLTAVLALDDTILNDNTEIVIELVSKLEKSVGQGTAAVVIYLPEKRAIPKFTHIYYTAQYSTEGPTIKIHGDDIAVTSDFESEVEVQISDPYNKYFDITHTSEKWELSIIKPLDPNILIDNTEIAIELVSTLDKSLGNGAAVVLVKLPTNEGTVIIEFDDPYYTADYSIVADGKDQVTPNKEIKLNIGDAEVAVVSEEYADNFDVQWDAGTCHLIVTKNLEADVLTSTTEILVVLQAFTADAVATAKATVIIRWPNLEDKIPKFTEPVYTANYKIDDSENHIVTLVDAIEINQYKPDEISIKLSGDNSNYFNVKLEDDDWQIEVTKNLPTDVLNSKASVILTLTAKLKDDQTIASSEAKLIIELPKTSAGSIYFEENVYTANYTITPDGLDQVVLNKDIKLATSDAEVTIVSEDYADKFDVQCDAGTCHLTVAENLDADILTSTTEILVVLQATTPNAEATGKTTVIIRLPKVPKFTKPVYTANYKTDDSENYVVTLIDVIEINEYEPDKISITLNGDYSDYFNVKLNDDNEWQIETTKNLPTNVLNSKTSVILTLTAKVEDDATIAPSESKLIIELPKTSASSIYFEENIYMADYDEDDKSIKVSGDIKVAGDTEDVDVSLDGDYSDNFKTTYTDGEVTITLTKELPSEIVERGGAITVNIKANKGTDTALTTLVVKLPPVKVSDDEDSPDNTGLIAAVAVLAVLLVAALVGSAVFYYIKFRRNSGYDDDMPYTKNIQFKPPRRRPTTGIVYTLQNEETGVPSINTSTTTQEEVLGKRKSVVFDTENIDELPIEKTEEDLELDEDDNEKKKDTEYENVSEL